MAIAIIAGIFFIKYTNRNPSWIIVAVCYAPDIDYVIQYIFNDIGGDRYFIIYHGCFHNILALTVFTIIGTAILSRFGIKWTDAAICTAVGFAAHLLEDAFVYNPAQSFFYPIYDGKLGLGIIPESIESFPIGELNVFVFGFVLLALAIGLKYYNYNKLKEIYNYVTD